MRPTWDEYFMEMASLASTRGTCLRRNAGAIIVKDKRILSTGYNGSPPGQAHCLDIGCIREEKGVPSGERHEICRALHAEQNAIIQASIHGVSLVGADIYSTTFPCVICAKMIAGARLSKVIYFEGYPDDLAKDIFLNSSVQIVKFSGELQFVYPKGLSQERVEEERMPSGIDMVDVLVKRAKEYDPEGQKAHALAAKYRKPKSKSKE